LGKRSAGWLALNSKSRCVRFIAKQCAMCENGLSEIFLSRLR